VTDAMALLNSSERSVSSAVQSKKNLRN